MMSVFNIIYQYKEAFLGGLLVTLKLVGIVWILGLSFGILIGVLASKFSKTLGIIFLSISFLITSIPVLVFLFWVHYPLQVLLKVSIDPFYSAIVVLSLVNIFSVSQIVKTAIFDFPKQYIFAAKVCGLSKSKTFFSIQFPLITRQIIPSLLPLQIIMLHSTLFASLISVEEIFRVVQRINSVIYKPIELYTALAVFFLIISLPVNLLAYWLKLKYTRDISEN
ncbi:MAG: ABC transporter permease subunit [Bacteroidales bacterium]|jgi:ABC-type amino acid transport system permease subunit|nr:ABC transporter permease subunit [Bacteroidales bacterium]